MENKVPNTSGALGGLYNKQTQKNKSLILRKCQTQNFGHPPPCRFLSNPMISYPGIQISLLITSVSNEDLVMHTMASAEGMLISMSLQCRDSGYVLWISLTVSFFQLGLSCFGCCQRGVVVWWIGAFISAYRGRWSEVLLARFIINDII